MGSTTHDLQKRGSATPTYKFLSNIARCQKMAYLSTPEELKKLILYLKI